MAKNRKKTNKTKVDADINLDDLDDLGGLGEDMDFGDEEGIDDVNRKPSRAQVIKDLGQQAGEGALESLVKGAAKKALPEEYSANYYEAMDLANFTTEVVSKNKEALNKSTYRLGKEVKKLLPFKVSLLDKYLESQESNFDTMKTQTEEQMRQVGIASETAAIFDKQLDVQKSLYARTEAQNEIDSKERLTQNKLSQDVLANMDGNIAHQTAFMTQISKEYYKRSLELQYKSFYVQADSLKTMREYYKAFAIQFTNIEKNTSLPDFVKLKNTEKLQDILREQAVQSVYGNLIGNNKYIASMKKKMSGFVEQKVQGVTSSLDEATGMLEMINTGSEGGNGLAMLGGVGANMAGSTLGGKLVSKIPEKYLNKVKENKTAKIGSNYLGMLGNSPSSLLESVKSMSDKKRDESADEATPGRYLNSKIFGGLSSLLNAGTPDAEVHEITQKGYLTHNQPAIFDNKVHRSITEVIPLYLAKILQSSSDMVSMYSVVNNGVKGGNGLLSYDYEGRSLTDSGTIATNIQKSVLKEKSAAVRSKAIGTSVLKETSSVVERSGMDKKDAKKLNSSLNSKESNDLLSKYIEEASKLKGDKMDFKTLFVNYQDQGNEGLNALIDKDDKLKSLVESIRKHVPSNTEFLDSRMKDLTRNYPLEGIKMLFKMTSALARTNTPNELDNKSAQSLSRAFTNYILQTGKDVTPGSVISKACFNYLLAEDADDTIMQSISQFLRNVNTLINTQDLQTVSNLERLFSLMNKGLREGQDVNPDVFKSLADLYPDIVGTGKLSADNVREGSLKVGGTNKYVDSALLINVGGILPQSDNDPVDKKTLVDSMVDSVKSKANGVSAFMGEAKQDPSAAIDKIWEKIKNTKTSVGESLNARFNKIATDVANLNNLHGKGINALKGAALIKLMTAYDGFIAKMEGLQSDMEKDLAERTSLLNSTHGQINEQTGEQSPAELGRITETYQKATRNSIMLIGKTIGVLKEQRITLLRLSQEESTTVTDKMRKFKDTFKASHLAITKALDEYRQAGKAVFSL